MLHFFHLERTRFPVRMNWFMLAIWALILAKCSLIWWAMIRWQVPMHPAWIVVPTLMFAALATVLWFARTAED